MIDMFSEANQLAAKIREIHEAFRRVGFTEAQAFEMTKAFHDGAIMAQLQQGGGEQ